MNNTTREYLRLCVDALTFLTETFRQFERGQIDETLIQVQAEWPKKFRNFYLVNYSDVADQSHDWFFAAGLVQDISSYPVELTNAQLELGFLLRQLAIAMQGRTNWKTEDVMEAIRLESLPDDDYFDEMEKGDATTT